MVFKKYLTAKRGGYITLVILLSAMMMIVPLLAASFGRMVKFADLSAAVILHQRERVAVLRAIDAAASSLRYHDVPGETLVNPFSSALLLLSEDSGALGEYELSSQIFNMNYIISGEIDVSDEAAASDILKFPPSRTPAGGEKYLLIRTTVVKNDAPSYQVETAVALSPSENVTKLWRSEMFIH